MAESGKVCCARYARNTRPRKLRHCPWPERPAIMKLEFSRWLGRGWTWNTHPLKYHCFCKRWNNRPAEKRTDETDEREREREMEAGVIEYRTLCGIMKTWPPPGNPRWHCFEQRSSRNTCKTLFERERLNDTNNICNFDNSSYICIILF